MLGIKTKPKSASTSSTVLCRVVASTEGFHTAGKARPREEALDLFERTVRGAEAKRDHLLPGFRIQLLTEQEYERRYGGQS